MTGLEIALIIIAVCFIIGSFMVTEKLTQKEIDQLAGLSKDELNRIVENSFSDAQVTIEDKIDEQLDASVEGLHRRMEKETNETITSIGDYAGEVMESLHKTHTEVMFLYSMLEDKEEELKKSVSNAMVLAKKLNEAQVPEKSAAAEKHQEQVTSFTQARGAAPVNQSQKPSESVKAAQPAKNDAKSSREEILKRHKSGISVIDIARELGLGKGEVQLVIDLYEGEKH